MDQSVQSQIETYVGHLDGLIRRGQELRETLGADPADATAMAATRRWQEDCGITINQLSGGSKAHWLARAFSQAFLMRSPDGQAAQGAAPGEIVQQLLAVLGQAVATLSQTDGAGVPSASTEAPDPRRFEFVHNGEIRPVLEGAYRDGRGALDQGDFQLALVTYCGILEAIVTDALEHKGLAALIGSGAPAGKISEWPFETRLAVAEKVGLIRGGAARLPEVARTYRDRLDEKREAIPDGMVSERDARRTGQVLHVIMRDLDPGR
ncbi:MAG: hypothetical protein WA824_00945 [Candidatus Sulfotelmatobacter sp.]